MAVGTRAPSTIVTVPLTGQTDFTIPFEYLARKFVVLTLLGIDRQVLVLNTDYRFVSKTVVSLSIIPGGQFTSLEIRRVTSASERLVDFHDGSILRAADMNLSQVQTLHVAEEARDLTADTIGVNDEGHLDARNRKMVNLANGENPLDAVNLGQLTQYDNSTLNNANRAEAAKDVAVAAERGSVAAKDEATRQAAAALQSEEHALVSKENAEAAERKAAQHVHDSGSNANVAAAAANHALQYQDMATVEANRARDEADRAKTEADKLTNWNDLAGTVEHVDSAFGVHWYGRHYTKGYNFATSSNGGARFGCWEEQSDGSIVMDIATDSNTSNFRSVGYMSFHHPLANNAWVQVNQTLKTFGQVETNVTLNAKWNPSEHGFAGQYHNDYTSVIHQEVTYNGTSDYFPIIKQKTFQGGRWAGVWSAGMLLTDGHPEFHIASCDEQLKGANFVFSTDGQFRAQNAVNAGAAVLWTDGNIGGSAWENIGLHSYLNRFVVNVYQGSDIFVLRADGYTDRFADPGFYMSGVAGTRPGVDGFFQRALYIQFKDGTTRVIGKA